MAWGAATRRAAATAAPSVARFQNPDVDTFVAPFPRRHVAALPSWWHPSGDRNPEPNSGSPTPKSPELLNEFRRHLLPSRTPEKFPLYPSTTFLSQPAGQIVGFVRRNVKVIRPLKNPI